ncbi:MAG: Uncharacterised protein [Cyanobium sp. ARS6]|nr:MAG: Uncharacterised protein [Cyanobium sp. ARS6]
MAINAFNDHLSDQHPGLLRPLVDGLGSGTCSRGGSDLNLIDLDLLLR